MTEEERKEVTDKLMAVGQSIVDRPSGDQGDIAIVGSIMALVFAITMGREQEFAELVLDRFGESKGGTFPSPSSDTSH